MRRNLQNKNGEKGSNDADSYSSKNVKVFNQIHSPIYNGNHPTIIKVVASVIISFTILVSYILVTRLGFGVAFPYQETFTTSVALLDNALEVVIELQVPPGNVAVDSKGVCYFTFHPEYNPMIKIARVEGIQTYSAYPSVEFQSKFDTVLSIRIDKKDRLWALDHGSNGFRVPKLFAFDTSKKLDQLSIEYKFPSSVAGIGSFLNDFRIDQSCEYIYIADTSIIAMSPAIIVYDVMRSTSIRVLNQHSSMFGQSIFLNVNNQVIGLGPFALKIHIDSIALSLDGSELYYGAVTSNILYRIKTKYIIDSLNGNISSETSIESQVEVFVENKPASDGLSIDFNGNIWLTAFEHSAIAVITQKKVIIKVVQDLKLLRWPDGLSFGPDGLYISNSVLHYKLPHKDISVKSDSIISNRNLSFYDKFGPFHIVKLPITKIKSLIGKEIPIAGQ